MDPVPTDRAAIELLIQSGIEAESRGDFDLAEEIYRRAIDAAPDSPSAHMNLGILLHGRGNAVSAAASHETAVRLDPASANAHYNLGLAQLELAALQCAELSFRRAIRLKPEFPEAFVALADALESAGRVDEAIEALGTAIGQRPAYVGAIFNAAILLRRLGRLDEAVERLRAVPADDPDAGNAMTALGASLRDQGRIAEAIEVLRRAQERMPRSGVTRSELLFTLGYCDPLPARSLFEEHRAAGVKTESETPLWRPVLTNRRDPDRPLRVGYLSGDFRGHSVSLFTEFLFERHDPDRVSAYAYSSTAEHDATTARIMRSAHAWRELRGQTDATAAETILADEIDILVDLAGHTGYQRIGVLAGRAAPIQMTWLGYINTTGLTRVDYRISDAVADPPGKADALHTERLLRMPNAQWCFRPPEIGRSTLPSRQCEAANVTFGSFNQFPKVSDTSLALWIEVMRANPTARLRIVGVPRGTASAALSGKLIAAGVSAARFDLIERVPLEAYYSAYNQVDVCLDTTPYSGGTTTCDALWMGVPVITLAGERSMSRSAASLLTCIGMKDMIANTPAEFMAIAGRLVSIGPLQAARRTELRNRMAASPLMDEASFTRDLESLYRGAWREWCARPGT